MPCDMLLLKARYYRLSHRLEAMVDKLGLADPRVLALNRKVEKLAVELQKRGMRT